MFLKLKIAESYDQTLSNEIEFTRGNIHLFWIDNLWDNTVMCFRYHENYFTAINVSMITAVDGDIWITLIFISVFYSFIWRNVQRGFWLLITLIGYPLSNIKKFYDRNNIWMYLVVVNILSKIYQSFISSDCLRLNPVHEFATYIRAGYKLFVTVKLLVAEIISEHLCSQSNNPAYQTLITLMNNTGGVYNHLDNIPFMNLSFPKLFEYLARSKVAFTASSVQAKY